MLDKLSQYHQRGLSCTKQQACMVWEHFGKIVKLQTSPAGVYGREHFGKIVKLQTIHVLARGETRKSNLIGQRGSQGRQSGDSQPPV